MPTCQSTAAGTGGPPPQSKAAISLKYLWDNIGSESVGDKIEFFQHDMYMQISTTAPGLWRETWALRAYVELMVLNGINRIIREPQNWKHVSRCLHQCILTGLQSDSAAVRQKTCDTIRNTIRAKCGQETCYVYVLAAPEKGGTSGTPSTQLMKARCQSR